MSGLGAPGGQHALARARASILSSVGSTLSRRNVRPSDASVRGARVAVTGIRAPRPAYVALQPRPTLCPLPDVEVVEASHSPLSFAGPVPINQYKGPQSAGKLRHLSSVEDPGRGALRPTSHLLCLMRPNVHTLCVPGAVGRLSRGTHASPASAWKKGPPVQPAPSNSPPSCKSCNIVCTRLTKAVTSLPSGHGHHTVEDNMLPRCYEGPQ